MLTIWKLVMTKLVWMNIMPVCQWNWICEDFFHKFFPLYFKKLAFFDQFSKIRFLGPHFCWRRSPLGPHPTQNWVPIGSPFWTKLGPRGQWEQCIGCIEIVKDFASLALILQFCLRSLSDLVALNIGQIGENLALGSATIVKAGDGEAICGLCHPRFLH